MRSQTLLMGLLFADLRGKVIKNYRELLNIFILGLSAG